MIYRLAWLCHLSLLAVALPIWAVTVCADLGFMHREYGRLHVFSGCYAGASAVCWLAAVYGWPRATVSINGGNHAL